LPEWVKSFLKGIGIFFSLLAVSGTVAYLTLIVLVPAENIEVPEVVGKKLEEAVVLLSQSELGLKVVRKKFSEEIPAGVIISQTPSPGTKVRQNRVIEVVVSGGARLVTVPSVVGMKVREAKINFSRSGIKIANISYVHSKFPQDEVISQDPPGGTEVSREEGISLLVSMGPSRMQLMVPDLRSKKIEEVVEWLEGAPLIIAMIKEKISEEEEGTVLSQSPPPGSMVEENTGIELVVSASPHKFEKVPLSPQKWVLTSVKVPLGFGKKKVSVVISDEEGEKTINYGMYSPGERIWISSEVVGKGEMRVYIEDKLIKLKKVGK